MKKVLSILFALIFSLSINAFCYRPEIDGEGGLFFVTGDNAASGIIMLIGCITIIFICCKIASFIDKDENSKGIKGIVANIFYALGVIAFIAAIGFAFALWWIVILVFILYAIGITLYDEIKNKFQTSHQEDNNSIIDSDVLIPFNVFENNCSNLKVGCVVNNYDGRALDVCKVVNSTGHKLFIGFSPYLGVLNPNELQSKRNLLYILSNQKEGYYFICSKDSEKSRVDELNVKHKKEEVEAIEILTDLNIYNKLDNYLFTEI